MHHQVTSTKGASYEKDNARIYHGDFAHVSSDWPSPTAIVVDGPYGLSSYPGDFPSTQGLAEWYRPYLELMAQRSTPQTTLWFWNSELGWATVHPVLEACGWRYRSCHIWDKGSSHIAGNSNSQRLRKFPVVTEVCVQYVREAEFTVNGKKATMQDWLRDEWKRTGLPFCLANEACGVANAATRKYLTACHLWYYPPVESFVRLSDYANKHGDPSGRPYFSIDGIRPVSGEEWANMRAKFYCEHGVTNVWREPPVNDSERIKNGNRSVHMNQKPLRLLELIIRTCTDENDTVWEPFGGLCSTAIAAQLLHRKCYSAEIVASYYEAACTRLANIERAAKDTAIYDTPSKTNQNNWQPLFATNGKGTSNDCQPELPFATSSQ